MREKGGILKVSLARTEQDDSFLTQNPRIEHGDLLRLSVCDTGKGIIKINFICDLSGFNKPVYIFCLLQFILLRSFYGFRNVKRSVAFSGNRKDNS